MKVEMKIIRFIEEIHILLKSTGGMNFSDAE